MRVQLEIIMCNIIFDNDYIYFSSLGRNDWHDPITSTRKGDMLSLYIFTQIIDFFSLKKYYACWKSHQVSSTSLVGWEGVARVLQVPMREHFSSMSIASLAIFFSYATQWLSIVSLAERQVPPSANLSESLPFWIIPPCATVWWSSVWQTMWSISPFELRT